MVILGRVFFIVAFLFTILSPPGEVREVAESVEASDVEPAAASLQTPVPCLVTPNNGLPGQTFSVTITLGPSPLVTQLLLLFSQQQLLNATFLFLPGGVQAALNQVTVNAQLGLLTYRGTLAISCNAAPGPRNITITFPTGPGQAPIVLLCLGAFTVTNPGGTTICSEIGGTVTDPRTGAAVEIPENTLKVAAVIKVITLDSPEQIAQINNSCGVPIQTNDTFPEAPGFVRATEVVRYEIQPCRTIAFGPGTRLLLPLLLSHTGLPVDTTPPLRLFELARSGGQLVFRDTGIPIRVTAEGGTSSSGRFVTVPGIQVFGTFAAFIPISNSMQVSSSWSQPISQNQTSFAAQQPGGGRLYFPIVSPGRQTRISIANPNSSSPLSVTFLGYLESGASFPSQSRTVGPNRQASFPASDLFPNLSSGAIIVERQGSGAMTGFYEVADNFQAPRMLGGAEAIQAPQPALVFPVVKSRGSGFTEVRVFNPNASSVNLQLAGFTASGARVNPTNMAGQPLNTITLASLNTLVVSSQGTSGNVRLNFATLDGGSIVAGTTDGQGVTGGEIFGETIGNQPVLSVLNGLSFPSGCLASTTDPCVCQVDTTAASPIPSSLQQHTLYAAYLEGDQADPILYLVNVSDQTVEFAASAFSEAGRFLATNPDQGFMRLNPHAAFQASMSTLFGFNPSPGYVRVEDQNSSLVGGILNRSSRGARFSTVLPLVSDDPRVTQTATTTFFSRVQLDSANPPTITGMLIFNPNNNTLEFTIKVIGADGTTRETQPPQAVDPRGTFTRVQRSLSVLFPNINLSSGFAQVRVTTVPGPGEGGRLIPVVVYRTGRVVSTVPQQNSQP